MPLLQVDNLTKRFPVGGGGLLAGGRHEFVRAVDGVDLTLDRGETLGLVGESGCGKSTLGRCILRLIEPSSGILTFDGRNLLGLSHMEMRRERRNLQIVFQDPMGSLNLRMRIGAILAEALLTHDIVPKSEVKLETARLLEQVGMPSDAVHRFPHEFSGGQRQRIGIARALSVRPKLIVADEPISALDVSIRAQILNLLRSVQQESGVAILFIAHDLGAVRQISDRIAVMYLGKIVETGSADSIYNSPAHPYTKALLDAIPSVEAKEEEKIAQAHLTDEPPSALNLPTGCRFRTRCPIAQDRCIEEEPILRNIGPNHSAACHFAG